MKYKVGDVVLHHQFISLPPDIRHGNKVSLATNLTVGKKYIINRIEYSRDTYKSYTKFLVFVNGSNYFYHPDCFKLPRKLKLQLP